MEAMLEKLKQVRVLVIGDMMLDHYIWGDVFRISPEAPVPVVSVEKETYTAGGAANVALNLANLGVTTSILGYCGNDDAGYKLRDIFKNNDIELVSKGVHLDVPTIIKTRVVIRNQQLCRIDREGSQESYQLEVLSASNNPLEKLLESVDAVIISDYAKGVIKQDLIGKLLTYAKNRTDLLIAVDPKPSRKLLMKGVGLLTPNRTEALQLAGLSEVYGDKEFPLEEVFERIYALYEPKILIITLGAGGMAICRNGKVVQHLPTEAKEVYDVSGAGDTVIATLTAALASGVDAVEAAKLSNLAAACVISHLGTAPIVLEELRQKISVALN